MHESTVDRERVAASRVARLATICPDGRPHIVPIVFALDGDTLYSAVDAKPKRSRTLRRIENARAHPEVAVLIDQYGEDWDELWWVRLDGRVRVLDGGEEADRAIELLRAKYPQYLTTPPGPPVLAVDIGGWRGWTARSVVVRGRTD
jgi:PPOX class probable F420-dependent enzyme